MLLKERSTPLAQMLEEAMLRKTVKDNTNFRQFHLAERVGVTETFISKILAGRVLPGKETLAQMELVLELEPGSLQALANAQRQAEAEERNARRQELARATLLLRDQQNDMPAVEPAVATPPAPDSNALLLQLMQQNQAMLEEMKRLREEVNELKSKPAP